MKIGGGMQLHDMVEVNREFWPREAKVTISRLLWPFRAIYRTIAYFVRAISNAARRKPPNPEPNP